MYVFLCQKYAKRTSSLINMHSQTHFPAKSLNLELAFFRGAELVLLAFHLLGRTGHISRHSHHATEPVSHGAKYTCHS